MNRSQNWSIAKKCCAGDGEKGAAPLGWHWERAIPHVARGERDTQGLPNFVIEMRRFLESETLSGDGVAFQQNHYISSY